MVGPQPRCKPWTPAADDQLHIMLDACMRAEEIARKLKRTVPAVYTRTKEL
jgi:hypothetical protein